MKSTTRTTKTTVSTSNKTFNVLTTETTRVLGYSYSNFAIKRQHKQLNHMTIYVTVQPNSLYLPFKFCGEFRTFHPSITSFVHFIDLQNFVLG